MVVGPPWAPMPSRWALDGVGYRIVVPPLMAVVNLSVGSLDDPESGLWTLFSVTDLEDHVALAERILDPDLPHVTLEFLEGIADDIMSVILGGMPRWMAGRVWQKVMQQWSAVDGLLLVQGVNLLDLPPDRATNAAIGAFRALLSGGGKAWEEWVKEVTTKPIRVMERDAEREDAELAAQENMRAMKMLTGFVPDERPRPQPEESRPPTADDAVIVTD